jgi:hypothetical protein
VDDMLASADTVRLKKHGTLLYGPESRGEMGPQNCTFHSIKHNSGVFDYVL